MPTTLGSVTVPDLTPVGTFPIVTDFPHSRVHAPQVYIHRFGAGADDGKIEQRFLAGNGARTFTVRRVGMPEAQRVALRNFWLARQGPAIPFTYNLPSLDGLTTTATICHFADQSITFEGVQSSLTSVDGLQLVEIPTTNPSYSISATALRFPSGGLASALLSQVQTLIPLLVITVTEPGYPVIYISDRQCTVGAHAYLPRLLELPTIEQGLGSETDEATFVLGNADRVMTALANSTDLFKATVQYSLYHVGTSTLINLWAGNVYDWKLNQGATFSLMVSDGVYELGLNYPLRKVSRACEKHYNDGLTCPWATASGAVSASRVINIYSTPTTLTFTPDAATCDRGFDTPNGCLAHLMERYYGATVAKPHGVRIKDNSQGGAFGFGRPHITSVSQVSDSVYSEAIPEIYCDQTAIADPTFGMPVNAKIIEGRDESEFYAALGIVGEGPLGSYAEVGTSYAPHKLDGQPNHGWPNPDQLNYGLRLILGTDPAGATDFFSLSEGGSGIQKFGAEYAAGTAFLEVRRQDQKGLQLDELADHKMQTSIRQGLTGYKWTGSGPFTRTAVVLSNPVWVMVNVYLKARGLLKASQAAQEAAFDVPAAIAAAAVCDLSVPKLVGAGSETQFTFNGILQDAKPLRDWLTEISNSALLYFTFAFGRLRIGIRVNASAVEAFTEGNILFQSLELSPAKPTFDSLICNFADGEFDFVSNAVEYVDFDYARKIAGAAVTDRILKGQLNLVGASGKSQASRVAITRAREELGGCYSAGADRPFLEFDAARNVAFKSTILSLNVEPGMVCSMTHSDMPDFQASNDGEAFRSNYGKFRVQRCRFNPDFSVDIMGRTVHNDCYDVDFGPKPADVGVAPVPVDARFPPALFSFFADTDQAGNILFSNLNVGEHGAAVHQALFEIYYVDETDMPWARLGFSIDDTDVSVGYYGAAPVKGEWIVADEEIMGVVDVVPATSDSGTVTISRGAFGTTAAAHNASSGIVASVNAANPCEFTVGTGLTLRPGDMAVQVTGGADIGYVAEYNASTGLIRFATPMPHLHVGNVLSIQVRFWLVKRTQETFAIPPRFFTSPARANFVHKTKLAKVGVVLIRGQVENTRGFRSDIAEAGASILFTSNYWNRLRTFETHKLVPFVAELSPGTYLNLFQDVQMPESQPFEWAYAEISGASVPIVPPRPLASIFPANYATGGTITIAGTITATGQIAVSITGAGQNNVAVKAWRAADNAITGASTAADVALSLADWLNADDQFGNFFYAAAAGAIVSITDLSGYGGTISTDVSGGVTAAAAGLTSGLGVLTGRRYALSYVVTGTYETERSNISDSSGPTGAATRIELKQIPLSTDVRVDKIRIYAAPDGKIIPMRRILEIANASTGDVPGYATAVDDITETALASKPLYSGPVQPANAGPVTITAKKNGQAWFQLFIPANAARSNQIHGYALNTAAEGAVIMFDVVNQAGTIDLEVSVH